MPPSLGAFKYFPRDIFRVNNGPIVSLRAWSPTSKRPYEVVLDDTGYICDKTTTIEQYKGPNGASMHLNSPLMQEMARMHPYKDFLIYGVEAGTILPHHLVLVQESRTKYSLQPMWESYKLDGLNRELTKFFLFNSKIYSREQFLRKYPTATEW